MDFDLKTEINGILIAGIDKGVRLFSANGCQFYRATVFGDEYCARLDDEEFVASQKIETLIDAPGNDFYSQSANVKTARLLAPLSLIQNNEGIPVGYLTEFVDFDQYRSIDCFFNVQQLKKLPAVSLQALTYKLQIALNLSRLVADLHRKDYYVINWSVPKILVHLTTREILLVDGESLSFPRNSDGRRNTTELTCGYVAPEFVNLPNAYDQFNQPQQDCFGLAVLLFQLLNQGIHPFQGYIAADSRKGLRTLDDCVAAGLYPYANTEHDKIKPLLASIHESLDDASRKLFNAAFFSEIDKRPTPQEWVEHFEKILANKQLARCDKFPDDPLHIKFSQKPCAACFKSDLPDLVFDQDARACAEFQIPLRNPATKQDRPKVSQPFVADIKPNVAKASSRKKKAWIILFCLLFVVAVLWVVETGLSDSSKALPQTTPKPVPQASTPSSPPPAAKPNPGAVPATPPKSAPQTAAPSAPAPAANAMQVSAEYANRIRNCIKPHVVFTPPSNSYPIATFRITLASPTNGSITGVNLMKSSGNSSFDRAVEAGIRQCGWLPLPTASGFYSTPIEVTYGMYEPAR